MCQRHLRTKVLILILLLNPLNSKAQNRTLEDLEAALVFKLCDYVTWPKELPDTLSVGLLIEDPGLMAAFNKVYTSISIQKKTVTIRRLNMPEEVIRHHVVFVDELNNHQLGLINEIITGKDILLFTENHDITNEFMFNLLPDYDKGMISFMFNRANLIFEGFDLHTDIIELRGSEIDIRDLYLQTRTRLESEEQRVAELSRQLGLQSDSISTQKELIDNQNSDINSKIIEIGEMNSLIQQQSRTILKNDSQLNEITSLLNLQEKEIEDKQQLLEDLQKDISLSNISLKAQDMEVLRQKHILDSLNLSISEKQLIIDNKDHILTQKENEINFRNKMIFSLLSMSIVTLLLLVIIYRTNRMNQKAKVILANQKEELQTTLEKLTIAQNQLIQSEKMASLGVLIAGIAHEINNPLNFISAGVSGLHSSFGDIITILDQYRTKYESSETNAEINSLQEKLELEFHLSSLDTLFENIDVGLTRVVNIVRGLQTFAHKNEDKELINIHQNLDLALTILHNQYKYNIEIIRNYGDIPEVECFADKMNQVFINILSNAIHAIHDKGKIEITTRFENGFVHINFHDNGSGIPDEIKNKIFDPFFTTKEVGKGTGIGLSLVYNIVQSHNGEISFTSKLGEYTQFTIKLPASMQ